MFGQSSHVHIEIIEALFEKVKDKQKLKIFSQIYKVIPTECKKKKKNFGNYSEGHFKQKIV